MMAMLKKSKELAKRTHQSTSVANQFLKDMCKRKGVKFVKLKNPNETRWNSQLTNMESVLRLKGPLQELFEEDEGDTWKDVGFTAADWKLLAGAVTILKPFLLATKAWEAEATPTINLVVERLYTLHITLNDFTTQSNCRYALSFARTLKRKLEERFPNQGMDVEERCFANYLDPRFKGIHLALVAMKGRIKESIKEKFGEGMHHTDNILDEVDMAPLSPTSKLLHQNQMMNEQQGSKMEQEMAQYEQMISPDRDSNILDFWKSHQVALPLLAKAARTILAIPASSSKSERVFSTGTRTVSNSRSSLAPSKTEDLIVIKENQRRIKEFKEASSKYDMKEAKIGAFSKVILHVEDDLEEAGAEDEESLLAYLDDAAEEEGEVDLDEVDLELEEMA